MAGRFARARGRVVVSVVTLVVAGTAVPAESASAAVRQQSDPASVEWWDEVEPSTPEDDPEAPPVEEAESAPLIEDTPLEDDVDAKSLPEPEVVEITLGGRGVARDVGDSPLELAAAGPAAAGETVSVEVLDQDVAERAGVRGFAFRLSGEDGAELSGPARLPATLSVDYSGFADLYGAGYAGRLRVLALPECAFEARRSAGCDPVGEPLPTRNESSDQRLQVDIADLRAVQDPSVDERGAAPSEGTGMVLAVLAGPEDENGSFKATPLTMSGDWQVGIGSGEFSWSYDMPEREAIAGPTPEVDLSYSSGAVDGMVTSRNSQAGRNGLGWNDFANSFIERRYNSCLNDGQTAYADLCWQSDNAVISLNGQQSELVQLPGSGGSSWALKLDTRWRVDRLIGADNGDDNGEHWRVTTPDGTQYWFGLGDNPEFSPFPTESVLTVPVVGDDAGEPCNSQPLNWCTDQAWRWNLDRVVDANGNTQTWEYEPEENNYLSARSGGIVPYVKGARLETVLYGTRAGSADDAQARVEFVGAYRCSTLADDEDPLPCDGPEPGASQADFPDVPVDLLCGSTCTVNSPTFFSIWRYARVEFYVRTPGWTLVNTVRLNHQFQNPDPTTTADAKLWLSGVQRTGHHPVDGEAPTSITLPPTTFEPVSLNNRFDPGLGESAMPHWRIGEVKDEFGREVHVTYGRPHPCTLPEDPDEPWFDVNTNDCFPSLWAPEGEDPTFRLFHKWLVTQIVVEDTTGGSPSMTTGYTYGSDIAGGLPDAAWHHDDNDFVPEAYKSWSEWRGYRDVLVTQGATRTRHRVFTGMLDDLTDPARFPGGRRPSTISSLDGTVVNIDDSNWLAGRTLDEMSLRADGTPERGVVHGYQDEVRYDVPPPCTSCVEDPLADVMWVAENDRVERFRTPAAGTVFARQRIQTTYNAIFLFPEKVIEHGWTDQSGDERCTGTGYVINLAAFMLDYPSSVTRHANTTCSGTEVTRVETAYDGAAVGTGPTYPGGNPTMSRTKVTASPLTWATTTTTYDVLGRPRVVTDPNGHTNTTTYHEATSGYPGQIDVTNHLGHTEETHLLPAWGVPFSTIDANGRSTDYDYDALGRVVEVRQPTEDGSVDPSWSFSYEVAPGRDEPPVVRSRQLQDHAGAGGAARYLDTWVVYDSMLRERQTHKTSPEVGKVIVSETAYDNRGLVAQTNLPQAVDGPPGSGILDAPGSPPKWANRTVTTYDAIGRATKDEFFATGATAERTTSTAYTYNSAEVTPPAGGTVLTVTDAYDRMLSVQEHDGTAYRSTAYTYDAADRMLTVTDPASNKITYTYDMAGRRLTMDDADAGDWEYAYDLAGNQTSVTDALDDDVVTVYDELDRPAERRADSPTGTVLTSWAYDADDELGLLDSSTRVAATGAWVVDVDGYDDRDRPLGRTWTVPAGITGLSGDHSVEYGYDDADHQTSVSYPATGDLSAEEITTVYNSIGQPETMSGTTQYVSTAIYDSRGRPGLFAFGSASSPSLGKTWSYNANQELAQTTAAATGGAPVQSRTLTYDKSGNVTQRDASLTSPIGTSTSRECLGYDQRQRLTSAYTTTTATTCASGSNKGTGPAAYNHTYTYTSDGNLDARTEGATTIDYLYPASGATSTRPHAPTSVGANTYTWDANGNLDSRTVAGQTEDFVWDVEHNLASIDDPDGDSTFTYDADGDRLLRQTAGGTTFYFEGHEVTVPASGSTRAVRSYAFADSLIASRDATGVEYLVTDNQGSVEASVAAGATSAGVARTYFPYGKVRSGSQLDTDRSWIGQVEDDATGLQYLNARYYDPSIGVFTSTDPLADLSRPETVNPYRYGVNNPTNNTDPGGRIPLECINTGYQCHHQGGSSGGGWNVTPPQRNDGTAELADLPPAIDADGGLQLGCFICFTLTPFHDRAIQLIQDDSSMQILSDWGCLLPGRGRPDLCSYQGSDMIFFGEVKYKSDWSITKGRSQLAGYKRRAGGAFAGGPPDWPSGPLREVYEAPGVKVTLTVEYYRAVPGLYTYNVQVEGDVRWIPALYQVRDQVETRVEEFDDAGSWTVPDWADEAVAVAGAAAAAAAAAANAAGGALNPAGGSCPLNCA